MKPRILIADDDESIRDIFQLILGSAGYELDIHADGEDILNNKFELPDLFLIDKQLSGLSGLDICRHLKDHPETMHIPVVMVSASPDIATLSIEAGADSFIEKPFEITHLLNIINSYTRQQEKPEPSHS